MSTATSPVTFLPGLADARQFPPARVLASPCLSPSLLKIRNTLPDTQREFHYTANGRNAIGLAAASMKKATHNRVLIPAYHCPALVEPFLWHGYEVMFYPLRADLSVDLSHLDRLITQTGATHTIFVRFFGFSQNIEDAIALANQRKLSILEDCAHALYPFLESGPGKSNSPHFRICSLNKFLPTTGGGAICPDQGFSDNDHRSPPLLTEGKALVRLALSNRPPRARLQTDTPASFEQKAPEKPATGFKYFLPEMALTPGYRHNTWICGHTDHDRVRKARRSNFLTLASALRVGCSGRPLYSELGDAVPYVFPFLLDDASHFTTLRRAGIQILRWEELAETANCPTSQSYRHRLVQIPCHQSLRKQDIDHIIHVFQQLGN